jgi:signal transduction histidine kinase
MKKVLFILFLSISPYISVGQYIKTLTYDQVEFNDSFVKDTLLIDSYLEKAIAYPIDQSNLSVSYFKKATQIANKLKSQEQLAKVFLTKGIHFWSKYDYFEAIKNFNLALPYCEDLKKNNYLSKLNYYLGESYYSVYSEDIAFKYYLRALNLYKLDNNEVGTAYCYNGLGTIYATANPKAGLYYINKALLIFQKHKKIQGISTSYINIANATEDVAACIALYKKSIDFLKLEHDPYNLAVNYNNLGDCYTSLSDYPQALSYFEQALALSETLPLKPLHSIIYLNIADLKLRQKLYKEAIFYSNGSLEYATSQGDVAIKTDNLLALSNIYEQKGELSKALQYKNEYVAVKERAAKYNDQKKIQLFQSLNDLEKSQFEIQRLKSKNESFFQKLQTRRNVSYLLLFITVGLISAVVILFLQKKEKNKIYALLQLKTEQISTLKDNVQSQNDYLSDLNNTKNKLFKIIAHDLKNPLSSIEALSDLMLQKDIDNDPEEEILYLNLIKDSATKASEILNDVLVWALNQEKPVQNKEVSVRNLIQEELKLLEIQALTKDITIHNTVPSDVMVITDKNKVATVIRNLISNAIKYSYSKGIIVISTEIIDHFIQITVKDAGVGLSNSELDTLFIVDYKKSKLGTANEEGTGLGLVLCKDFVQKLGGKMIVTSEPNSGSAFSFTLPYASVAVLAEEVV